MFSSRYGWIGVDVGTHTVKLAQTVRDGGRVRLHRAAVIQRPTSWSGGDDLALAQPISSYPEIRAAIECGDFVGRNAVSTLPMNICQLRSLNVPPGTDDERRTIIADELAEDWAELRSPMEFDYWETDLGKTEKGADSFNVNVLATSRLWISQLWRDCRRGGLDCWSVDGLPLAMARTVGLAGGCSGGKRALVVDWGYSNTTLCIAGDHRSLYSRRIHDCSLGRVVDAICKELDVTLDEAQHLIDHEGLLADGGEASNDVATARAITSAASGALDELVRQVSRTLQFAEMQRKHLQPAAVWLLGGGASLRNVGPYLAAALAMPVRIWGLEHAAEPIDCAAGNRAAVFGSAAALSSLVWRAA